METEKQIEVATLEENIKAYQKQLKDLMEHYEGKYVIFHDRKRINTFDSFDAAAREAIRLFGDGPYLIRQVGQEEIRLSSSVLFTLAQEHASG